MLTERTKCAKKLEAILAGLVAEGVSITINTQKESACADPFVESVQLQKGSDFVIFQNSYGQNILVKPTPKLVKKHLITGTVGGVEVSKVFTSDQYSERQDFFHGLVNATSEDIEEPEA